MESVARDLWYSLVSDAWSRVEAVRDAVEARVVLQEQLQLCGMVYNQMVYDVRSC